MSYCKYHPLAAATFACRDCQIDTCDACSNEDKHGRDVRCFLCDQPLDSLGAANQTEPFWRRFDQSFRYPLNAQSITVIVILSAVSAVALHLPFALLWYCAATGALIKYGFSCLQNTAQGDMTAPDITASYGDGVGLVLRLLVIIVAISAAVFGLFTLLGVGAGSLAASLAVAALPAIIIMFAMTDRIIEAINPVNVFRLISAIGLPYGLLLAIILVMMGSMEFISTLIGEDLSFVSMTLNAIVSNYYSLVIFHIMGYMLFQYQGELGFAAREDGAETPAPREDQAWVLAKAQILVKEGRYGEALALLASALEKLPNNELLNTQYFELLLACSSEHQADITGRLQKFASAYLRFLEKNRQPHKMIASFNRVLKSLPDFKPDSASLRLLLARSLRNNGNGRAALQLLNGLHKQFPDAEELIPAYQLMADILDNLPNMGVQAEKCRALIATLQRHQAADATTS